MAAANALLLQEKIKLPASAIRNNVASLSDLTNVLANFALQTPSATSAAGNTSAFLMDELLTMIPRLQDGMDVNPKFTASITGYEFTQELTCFDLWQVKLVHGWLIDPSDESMEEVFKAVGGKTYNELIEVVIQGKDADEAIPTLRQQQSASSETTNEQDVENKLHELEQISTKASYIDHFLNSTGHQLTQYGLSALHQELQENELVVFFRNNHFCTMTKHENHLYLLVTDLGYANTPMVVWERLDVIDGDTEYVNSQFKQPGEISQEGSSLTPEQLMAQAGQNDADYHLALHLSMQPSAAGVTANSQDALDSEEGKLMAAATEASLRDYHGQAPPQQQPQPTTVALPPLAESTEGLSADEMLARQLAREMEAQQPSTADDERLARELAAQQQPSNPGNMMLTPSTGAASGTQVRFAGHNTTNDEALARQLAAQQQSQPPSQPYSMDTDAALARRLQQESAESDEQLARRLQQEENARNPPSLPASQQSPRRTAPASSSSANDSSKCIIS